MYYYKYNYCHSCFFMNKDYKYQNVQDIYKATMRSQYILASLKYPINSSCLEYSDEILCLGNNRILNWLNRLTTDDNGIQHGINSFKV